MRREVRQGHRGLVGATDPERDLRGYRRKIDDRIDGCLEVSEDEALSTTLVVRELCRKVYGIADDGAERYLDLEVYGDALAGFEGTEGRDGTDGTPTLGSRKNDGTISDVLRTAIQ